MPHRTHFGLGTGRAVWRTNRRSARTRTVAIDRHYRSARTWPEVAPSDVGSWDLKLDRAEKHLAELETEIRRYTDSHPYEVRPAMEGNRKVYRFHFTGQPSEHLPVIAGDFLYNVDSALNHIACAMVPSKNRFSVYFPVLWQGVWEPLVEGENKQRGEDRGRWQTYTRDMPDGAVTIVKGLQPDYAGPNKVNTLPLAMLRALRNRDAHTKLMVVAAALTEPIITLTHSDGTVVTGGDRTFGPTDGLQDGAPITGAFDGVVKVEASGSPRVVVRVGQNPQGGFEIARAFREQLLDNSRRVVDALRPYVR